MRRNEVQQPYGTYGNNNNNNNGPTYGAGAPTYGGPAYGLNNGSNNYNYNNNSNDNDKINGNAGVSDPPPAYMPNK